MTRLDALSIAIAEELTRRRAVIEAGPRTLTLVVKLDADGTPYAILCRPEFEARAGRLRKTA